MKHYLHIIIACLIILPASVWAQESYTVKSGTPLSSTFTFSDIYQYPTFTAGRVLFKNGRSGGSKMNYNLFTGEMEFIEGKDTLSLADKESIKAISIGTNAYYYQGTDGYLQRVSESAYAKLAVRKTIRLVDRQREAGYGKTSTAGVSAVNNSSLTGGNLVIVPGRALSFVSSEDLIYRKLVDYYFGNAKGFFIPAEKKNLIKAYPEKKASINAYLKENNVDWMMKRLSKTFSLSLPI